MRAFFMRQAWRVARTCNRLGCGGHAGRAVTSRPGCGTRTSVAARRAGGGDIEMATADTPDS